MVSIKHSAKAAPVSSANIIIIPFQDLILFYFLCNFVDMKHIRKIILTGFLAIADLAVGILQLVLYKGAHNIFIGIFFIVYGICNLISLLTLFKQLQHK